MDMTQKQASGAKELDSSLRGPLACPFPTCTPVSQGQKLIKGACAAVSFGLCLLLGTVLATSQRKMG